MRKHEREVPQSVSDGTVHHCPPLLSVGLVSPLVLISALFDCRHTVPVDPVCCC